MMFQEKVIAEAIAQHALLKQHKPIPSEQKRYARIVGLTLFVVSGIGELILFFLGILSGTYYTFAILFAGAISLMGLIQAISGRHILTARKS